MRLIDLFHITDNRTPYALWRFVSPNDDRSEEEWKKHRALHGVTVIDFPPGRAIKVQGFTEDEEVWAGLEDLRRYCDDQVNQSLNLCARNIPQRYMLNFLKLEWMVTTGTLRPVDLAFGFDSNAMFRILSEDIYNGDRYIFLRELLQNSIDAIRMRCSRHQQRAKNGHMGKRSDPPFDTTIYFDVEHQSNGDILVKCRDYGIGMDEHIIRHYFAVAGISYYRSEEFKRQHAGFEPVSCFGIGILSCFMVSDKLEVKTYRDPECGPPMTFSDKQLPGAEQHHARRLHLRVPSVGRQFIVKDLPDDFDVGTEISLEVLKKKAISKKKKHDMNTDAETKKPKTDFKRTLEITEYLCEIAGFVEFPIVVKENWPDKDSPKLTMILHPDQNTETECQKFTQEMHVHQLSREYPWDNFVDNKNNTEMREFMVEHRLELRELLGDDGHEGWVVFPTPLNEEWDFRPNLKRFFDESETVFHKRTEDVSKQITVKWSNEELHKDPLKKNKMFGVYRDGILLREIEKSKRHRDSSISPVMMHVNLSSSESPQPNVSRTKFDFMEKEWDESIWTVIDTHLCNTFMPIAIGKPPVERLYYFGWIKSVFGLSNSTLLSAIPADKIVTLWLKSNGVLEARENAFSGREEIPLLPVESNQLFKQLVSELWNVQTDLDIKIRWNGPTSVGPPIEYKESIHFSDDSELLSRPASSALEMLEYQNQLSLTEIRLQFLEPPEGQSTFISQSINTHHLIALDDDDDDDDERREFLERPETGTALVAGQHDPNQLEPQQRKLVMKAIGTELFIPFGSPFSEKFAFSTAFNSCHPIAITLLRCLIACRLAERDKKIPKSVLTTLGHIIDDLNVIRSSPSNLLVFEKLIGLSNKFDILDFINQLSEIVESYELIDGFTRPSIPPASEFVPNTQGEIPSETDCFFGVTYEDFSIFKGVFGKQIKEWPLKNRKL